MPWKAYSVVVTDKHFTEYVYDQKGILQMSLQLTNTLQNAHMGEML